MSEYNAFEYDQFSSSEYVGYDNLTNHTYSEKFSPQELAGEVLEPVSENGLPQISDELWEYLQRGFNTGCFEDEKNSFHHFYRNYQQEAHLRGKTSVDSYFYELAGEMRATILDYEFYNYDDSDVMQDVREANETLVQEFNDLSTLWVGESVAWYKNSALQSIYFMLLGASILLLSQFILGVFA